jgi:hypothetical protein
MNRLKGRRCRRRLADLVSSCYSSSMRTRALFLLLFIALSALLVGCVTPPGRVRLALAAVESQLSAALP